MTATEPTPDAADVSDVETGRARIDEIDAAIRDLVAERVTVSRTVQQLRKVGGRPGIQHARENQIIGGYVDALGDPGADIALAVLALCRGRLTS